jgi:hypothetical protein
MPGKPPGELVLGITAAIKECGPMTTAELRIHLDRGINELGSVVTRMNRASKLRPKRLQIVAYVYESEGSPRYYPRAVYALGDGPDKPKPKPDRNVVLRRYRNGRRKRIASVFDLGLSLKERNRPKKGETPGPQESLAAG